MRALIADPKLARLETLLAEFNLFNVLGVARSEIHHSRVIAWLLDPRGSHGLRDYFLRGFLSQAAVLAKEHKIKCVTFTPLDIDGWNFGGIEVATERQVGSEPGYIDILLIDESDGFVCLIENKIQSGEHSDQLRRYLKTVKRVYSPKPFPIYLTPDGRKPEKQKDAKRWIPFDYGKIADLVERALDRRGSTINSSVASFLVQYERTLRRHVVDTPSDIDRLALHIYREHSKVIDIIIKAKSSSAAMYWDIIEPAIERYAPNLKHDDTKRTMRRFFVPHFDDIPGINKGERWTESRRMILFEFKYMGNMEIWLTVGPGPQKTRECLYQLAVRVDKPFYRSKRMGDWFYIYRKPILDRQDFNPFDPDKARPKIEKAIAEFFEQDYWPLVNAIRKEFNLPAASPS